MRSCFRNGKVFKLKEWGTEVSGWKNLDFWTLAKRKVGNFIWGCGVIAFHWVVCSGFSGSQGAGLQEKWRLKPMYFPFPPKHSQPGLITSMDCWLSLLSHPAGYFMGTLSSLVMLESQFCVPQLQGDPSCVFWLVDETIWRRGPARHWANKAYASDVKVEFCFSYLYWYPLVTEMPYFSHMAKAFFR